MGIEHSTTMSESFFSARFGKNIWLTNHAIEAMTKRKITLPEIKKLIEFGEYREKECSHGWIYYEFPDRDDNVVCVAFVNQKAIIIKTVMVRWKLR